MTTRQYLRFSPGTVFGVIASSTANILQINRSVKENTIAVPACENVILWNLQTKEQTLVLEGEQSYVSCLTVDYTYKNLAVGYSDGIVRIYDLKSGTCTVTFCGHKSAVSCLCYENEGLNLASGGKDSEIVIWNVTDQAGLFRLKGHKGPVSKCHFFKQNILISSSKDTFLKFWDLETQHCFYTLVGNRNEVLDFVVIKESKLISGINGPDLRVWDLSVIEDGLKNVSSAKKPRLEISSENFEQEDLNIEAADGNMGYSELGQLKTMGDKTVALVVDRTERLMGCHASTKVLQLYKILNSEEVLKRFQKRKRKEKKRKMEEGMEIADDEFSVALVDEFQPLEPVLVKGKIDSCSITVQANDISKITVLLKNNSILQYQMNIKDKNSTADLCHSITVPGHRTIVRSLSYSTDSLSILSASEESVKIWKSFQGDQKCAHTISSGFALCSVYVTGNNHCIIGTKEGSLAIYDINAGELLENMEAHLDAVNCISLDPSQCGIASGSKDKDVKFWDFELILDEKYSTSRKRLSLSLKRTLKMPDEVLCLVHSPDSKKIAISLLDNTVQVLFADTLKLVFSLYGHSLPVTCMDISYDGFLIATASEDKDIRIWSMEFGSCNKFIKKAHDKGITCLKFLPKTHLFFTGARDNTVKQWDADNFQKIVTLKGHQSELTAMSVAPDGSKIVTASRDKSIRIWVKTREPLVLEEEQEKEREEENEEAGDLPVVPGEVNKEVGLPGLKTTETIKSVDQLIEAIEVFKGEILKLKQYEMECQKAEKELPVPAPHPLLIAVSTTCPVKYMRKVVHKMKSSELEGTLLYLPFNYVLDFLKIICEFVDRGWDVELCERCTSFLIRIHLGQILSSENFQPVIERLKEKLFSQVYEMRDLVGFTKTAAHLQQLAIDAQEEVPMFTSVLDGLRKKKKSKKKLERSVLTFC